MTRQRQCQAIITVIYALLAYFNNRRYRYYLLFTLKLSVSVSLLAWLLLRADLGDFTEAFKKTDLWLFSLSLLSMSLGIWVRTYKWQLLMKAQKVEVPLRELLSTIYISMFLNNFFLGTLGGDAYRVYWSVKHSSSTSAAFLPVLMDRITGFFSALWIVIVVGLSFVLSSDDFVRIQLLLVLGALGISVAIIMVSAIVLTPLLVELPILKLSPKIRASVQSVSDSLKLYRHHRGIVSAVIGISLLFHLIHTATVYLFTLAAAGKSSLLALLLISPLVGLLAMIPISVNGLGIQEGSYVFYLEKIGLSGSEALLVAMLARIAGLVISLVGAWLFLLHRKKNH